MSSVEQLFIYPKDEIRRMENDYYKMFGPELAEFIKNRAMAASSHYHDQCAHVLLERFIEMNKIVKKFPSEPSKKQYDEFVQNILALAEPSEIAEEMKIVIHNDEVYSYYQDFLKQSENDLFHELYNQCAFTKGAALRLNQLAVSQIKQSIQQLHAYIGSLHSHNRLIKQIQEKRQGDSVLKTVASIAGLGLGIPFLGMGLGALLGSGDKQKIQESLGNIFDHIGFVEESLYNAVEKLGDSLYLLFLTLIGGTFVSVNHALKTQNLRIEKMNQDYVIIYSLTPDEKEKFEKWFHVSITGITALVKAKRWQEAIGVVKKMHQSISQQPVHAYHEISLGKSALYIAHVYYYAVYQEALLEEFRAGHKESFLTQAQAFLDTLILYPLEKDFPAFASHPAVFLFLYIKQSLHQNSGQWRWLEKADAYIKKRHEKTVLMGEYGEHPKDYAKNMGAFFIGWELFDQMKKYKDTRATRKTTEQFYRGLTEEKIEQFIAVDQSLNHPDELTHFLQTMKVRKRKAKRAPFIRWGIRLAAAAALILLLVVFTKPLIPKVVHGAESIGGHLSESTSFMGEKWSSLTSSIGNIWSSFFGDEDTNAANAQGVIMITEPTVNIRETPSLDGNIIATGYAEETYSYLNEEQTDGAGVTWLTIELPDGRTAYVSKKVAVIQ